MAPSKSHLSQSEFFDRLEKLFSQRKGGDHGAIHLSQKRLKNTEDTAMPSADEPFPDLNTTEPHSIVIRASNGKSNKERDSKVRISTVVKPEDLEEFYTRYADICKTGMTALKPRDRNKKKLKAKKKKNAS
ncbi:unnamed protein product [Clonostachys solani]|uniref:Signal recognition particle subunit SRP14 n=1 Tax=Clonostachys solani TaxID=160281 RepID=A0A9N9VXR7_9HYPO|nr:unnamed protein product [Clonostachys solani]